MSLEESTVVVNQGFNSTYTNGTTTLASELGNDWISSNSVIVGPTTSAEIPNNAISVIVTDANISLRDILGINYPTFNPISPRTPILAFIKRGNSGTSLLPITLTYSETFTTDHIMSYRYWLRADTSSSFVVFKIIANGVTIKEYTRNNDTNRFWRTDSVNIPAGTSTIEIQHIDPGGSTVLNMALEDILITKNEGLYYTTDTGIVVNKGTIGSWVVEGNRIRAKTNSIFSVENENGFNQSGIFIGNPSNTPSFSMVNRLTFSEDFNGTFTSGSFNLNDWTISDDPNGVYLDYITAPDQSVVVTDYNIRNETVLTWAFNSNNGTPYFLVKNLAAVGGYVPKLTFNFPDTTTAYSISFRYNAVRNTGTTSSFTIVLSSDLNTNLLTLNSSTNVAWATGSVSVIPAGTSNITFTFTKGTISSLALYGLDNIVITNLSTGLSYNMSNLILTKPKVNGTDIVYDLGNFTNTVRSEQLTQNRIIQIPNLSGTVALLENTQTFTGQKTFQGNIVVSTGTSTAANAIVINTSGQIIFEGSSADANETVFSVVNPTADQTYQLPNKTAGTYTIATITDLQDDFVDAILTTDGSTLISLSYADISGMSLTLKQNTYYRIKFFGTYNRPNGSSTAIRISMPFLTSATNAYVRGSGRYAASSTATALTLTPLFSTAATTSSDNNSFSLGSANAVSDSVVEFEATIFTGSATGIKLQYIMSTGGGGGIIFRRGTFITAERLT